MQHDKYGDAEKQLVREKIWGAISKEIHAPLARVLFFPGSKRYELDTVLKYKFRLENIYMVEKNLAVKANFTRSSRLGPLPPKEHFYRMYLSEAATILAKNKIQLDAAHLDFCTNCESIEMLSEIQKFFRANVLRDNGILAITAFAMREVDLAEIRGMSWKYKTSGVDTLARRFQELSNSDQSRLLRLWNTLGMQLSVIDFGKYFNKTGNSLMLWTLFRVSKLHREK